jgi:hypothetical protein
MIVIIDKPENYDLPINKWYIINNTNNNNIIVDIHYVNNTNSIIYSPFTLIIADEKEELINYIKQNNLFKLNF